MESVAIEDRIIELVTKRLRNEITDIEAIELASYENSNETVRLFIARFTEAYLENKLEFFNNIDTDRSWKQYSRSNPVLHRSRVYQLVKRIAVAAVFVFASLACAYWFLFRQPAAQISQAEQKPTTDTILYAPVGNKALLTLANGEQLILDTAKNGILALQGGSAVSKNGDELNYQNAKNAAQSVMNTITTPRGSNYRLVLADGSKLWLNASSKLIFPSKFTGNERRIELHGEAYVEVAKNAKQPFIVSANGADIKVLGTSFNVNTYTGPSINTTTLIEGAVQVTYKGNSSILKPGQQVSVSENGDLNRNSNVDTYAITAWVRNKFYFENKPLTEVMETLARWYDFSVIYKTDLRKKLVTAMVTRSSTANSIFSAIEESCNVEIEISGNQVAVREK